jgi:glucosamine kinase
MQAVRAALNAHDGRIAGSSLTREIIVRFGGSPHEVVRWSRHARPGDYAAFAPLVAAHAATGDAAARGLLQSAASHIEALLTQLVTHGAQRLSLVGGLAETLLPYLGAPMRTRLSPAKGDALQGALRIAAHEARQIEQEAG